VSIRMGVKVRIMDLIFKLLLLLVMMVCGYGGSATAGVEQPKIGEQGVVVTQSHTASFELVCWQEGREILRKTGRGQALLGKQFIGQEMVTLRHQSTKKKEELKLLTSTNVTCLLTKR
jgi:hypothetical protein